jgi:hypothetical protein
VSEYAAYDDEADVGFDDGVEPVEQEQVEPDAGAGWSGPTAEEWQQAQETIAQANELVDAVRAQSLREQQAVQAAQVEQWIGDPLDDPAQYAERVRELARAEGQAAAAAQVAPFEQWLSRAEEEYVAQQADAEVASLFGHHSDPDAARETCDTVMRWQIEQLQADGVSEAQARAAVETRENALAVIAMFNAEVERQASLRAGDETSLPALHLPAAERDDAPMTPGSAAHRAVMAYALGKQ